MKYKNKINEAKSLKKEIKGYSKIYIIYNS